MSAPFTLHMHDLYNPYLEAAMILFEIMLCVFLHMQRRDETVIHRRFMELLYVLTAGTILDVIVCMGFNHEGLFPVLVFRVLRAMNGIFGTAVTFMVLRYVLAFAHAKSDRITEALIAAPLILCIGLWMSNPFTGIIISYTPDHYGERGALFMVMHYYYPLFYIFLTVVCLILYRRRYERIQRIALLCNLFFIIALFFYQMLAEPELMTTYYIGGVAVFAMFFALETPAYNRLVRAGEALAYASGRSEELTCAALAAEQSKTVFLSNVSKEMMHPVSQILKMDSRIIELEKDANVRQHAYELQEAATRLNTIISSIHEYTCLESGEAEIVKTPYETKLLLDEICASAYRNARVKELEFSVAADPALPFMLRGDKEHIAQMVSHLTANAIRYTDRGGIRIQAFGEYAGDGFHLILKVTDTGTGIRGDEKERLFQPFARLSSHGGSDHAGSGMGLAITKSLAKAMHGSVSVTSEVLTGSAFTVDIPQEVVGDRRAGRYDADMLMRRLDRIQMQQQEENLAVYQDAFAGRRILAADDAGVVLSILKNVYAQTGAVVETVTSGEACIAFTQNHPYDLILLDLHMPEEDGEVILQQILGLAESDETFANPDTPVFAMTGEEDTAEVRERLREKGFRDTVFKPFDPGILLEKTACVFRANDLQ